MLRQLSRCAQRDSEAHGKRFVPDVKVPETYMQHFAFYIFQSNSPHGDVLHREPTFISLPLRDRREDNGQAADSPDVHQDNEDQA